MRTTKPRRRRQLLLFLATCLTLNAWSLAHAEWVQREEAIMGTRIAVELWADDAARGEALITRVMDEMRRVDELMRDRKSTRLNSSH